MSNKIEPLRITRDKLGADLAILHIRYGVFDLNLDGHGFTSNRVLTADDLREIRDWINTALASVEPHTEGEGA